MRNGGVMTAATCPASSWASIPCVCGPWIDSSFLSSPPPSPSAPGRRPPRGPWFCGAAWRLAPWCRCYCCCCFCCYCCCSSRRRSSPSRCSHHQLSLFPLPVAPPPFTVSSSSSLGATPCVWHRAASCPGTLLRLRDSLQHPQKEDATASGADAAAHPVICTELPPLPPSYPPSLTPSLLCLPASSPLLSPSACRDQSRSFLFSPVGLLLHAL